MTGPMGVEKKVNVYNVISVFFMDSSVFSLLPNLLDFCMFWVFFLQSFIVFCIIITYLISFL